MRVYKAIERILETLTVFFWRAFILVHELKNIWAKRALVCSFRPTKEQAKEAEEYWRSLVGRRIPLWWHRLYASYTGKWDPRYIPEILFSVMLEPNGSRRIDREALDCKSYLDLFCGTGLRQPREIASLRSGVPMSGGGVVSMSELLDRLQEAGPCVVKPVRDTSSGIGVHVADFRQGKDMLSGATVVEVISSREGEWVCQEKVAQDESLSAIYPHSANTLRIVTYLTDSGVRVAPVTLRIGQGDALVDNAHAGGMFVHVDEGGRLSPEAYTECQERFISHPDTRATFEGRRISGVRKAVEACRRRHAEIGGIGFISWDVCIDEKGEPVLIEVNLVSQTTWFPQMASGEAMFGADTPRVVRRYWRRRA